ncbi:hypothetical protein ACPOL_5475 [Acidisarcina polymorpha]|uniref:Uncharacterized protein n=1 Tax=Acidisarcina polymorpha TaxID=2211140 RepID=A0A2Z5G652_9BACT|nr:hypothetical protein [Acidisarcina polymorpha]AXC14723.1 hypothetical protein ACPOL_5475 [Acidisarcina polymorpha]
MNIAGISNASVLSDLYASGTIGNTKASSPLDGDGATVSEIRDKVDGLATSGKLTTLQQVALIASGFQDLNANDPSYQPTGQTGYTRATSGNIDFTGTLQSIGDFDAAHGDLTDAAKFTGLADLFKQDSVSSSNSLDVKG